MHYSWFIYIIFMHASQLLYSNPNAPDTDIQVLRYLVNTQPLNNQFKITLEYKIMTRGKFNRILESWKRKYDRILPDSILFISICSGYQISPFFDVDVSSLSYSMFERLKTDTIYFYCSLVQNACLRFICDKNSLAPTSFRTFVMPCFNIYQRSICFDPTIIQPLG